MNKPPAFQFYPDDFLGGTVSMNFAQRGLYITLLSIQWNQGFITQEDMEGLISDGSAIAQPLAKRVFSKFDKCEDGLFRNSRLEKVRAEQKEFRASRSRAGKSGAEARWGKHGTANGSAIAQPMANHMANHMAKDSSPTPTPIGREKEDCFAEIPPMQRKDYDQLAESRGIPKECADWLWNTLDARNWTDKTGQIIRKVEPMLLNAAKTWRAQEAQRTAQSIKAPYQPKQKTLIEKMLEQI